MNDRLLTAREVAEMLSVPVSWVRESTRSGAIPCVELGRYRRYRRGEVLAWLEACSRPGRPVVDEVAEARALRPNRLRAPGRDCRAEASPQPARPILLSGKRPWRSPLRDTGAAPRLSAKAGRAVVKSRRNGVAWGVPRGGAASGSSGPPGDQAAV